MAISKETKSLNMPWEQEYGYSQAVKVGDTIYLSGQVSHDDKGNIVGLGDMEMQMRQAYANVQKVLAQYGATMANIVDEVLFVTPLLMVHGLQSQIYTSMRAVATIGYRTIASPNRRVVFGRTRLTPREHVTNN